MVLEESLLFYEEADADRFIQFLRQNNCRAQKATSCSVVEETLLKGTIGNQIQLAEKLQKSIRQEGSLVAGGETGAVHDHDCIPPVKETRGVSSTVYTQMIENLTFIRNYTGDIMNRYEPGNIVCTLEEIERVKASFFSYFNENNARESEGDDDASGDFLRETMMHDISLMDCWRTMEDNGIAEITQEGLRLTQKIDPNDLVIMRGAWHPNAIDKKVLQEQNVVMEHHLHYETGARVFIDPKIHLLFDPEDVDSFLNNCEVDEEDIETLVKNMYLKKNAIKCVLDVVTEKRRITLSDLTNELRTVASIPEDGKLQVVMNFSPEFVAAIVNDMRKIGLIEGNDRKIRAV